MVDEPSGGEIPDEELAPTKSDRARAPWDRAAVVAVILAALGWVATRGYDVVAGAVRETSPREPAYGPPKQTLSCTEPAPCVGTAAVTISSNRQTKGRGYEPQILMVKPCSPQACGGAA